MTDLTTGKSEKMLDISLVDKDIEQLAAVLNQYNEKQRQSIASILRHEMYLKESIANISHDLRTPLTVILGHLQLLKKENLSAGQTQRIETIFNKAERMKELIQTFYDLSVIDAKEVTPVREDFNLTNLLINLITENAPALEAKGISPVIGLPDHSVYLHSDYGMVERIFQNLIINAIRYSSGSIKIDLKQGKEKSAIFIIENPIDSKVEIDPNRLF
ncbi:sensor histidine kinase [Hominenteromicrobium sp.]